MEKFLSSTNNKLILIGAFLLGFILLFAYVLFPNRCRYLANQTINSSPTPSIREQTKPRPPTATPLLSSEDKDELYSGTVQFKYSFKHLPDYTVVRNHSLEKIGENGKTVASPQDPNYIKFRFMNYYYDYYKNTTDKTKPYTKDDVYEWIKGPSSLTSDQCFNGTKISEVVIKNKTAYKVENTCGAKGWYKIHSIYLLELHKSNGDFLVIDSYSDSPEKSKQLNLFLDTFSLTN
jgi:hypothetical protein